MAPGLKDCPKWGFFVSVKVLPDTDERLTSRHGKHLRGTEPPSSASRAAPGTTAKSTAKQTAMESGYCGLLFLGAQSAQAELFSAQARPAGVPFLVPSCPAQRAPKDAAPLGRPGAPRGGYGSHSAPQIDQKSPLPIPRSLRFPRAPALVAELAPPPSQPPCRHGPVAAAAPESSSPVQPGPATAGRHGAPHPHGAMAQRHQSSANTSRAAWRALSSAPCWRTCSRRRSSSASVRCTRSWQASSMAKGSSNPTAGALKPGTWRAGAEAWTPSSPHPKRTGWPWRSKGM